ncbi:hypothetical protein [Paenibacillus xylanexedens]|uniref:hypothetical protein n=1 Tax=Paenibacillus xylanexedens TaxID=528191 RepID=UPI0011AA0A1E|nr:hypothetical protein [Paenibacillus xylanexedens]
MSSKVKITVEMPGEPKQEITAVSFLGAAILTEKEELFTSVRLLSTSNVTPGQHMSAIVAVVTQFVERYGHKVPAPVAFDMIQAAVQEGIQNGVAQMKGNEKGERDRERGGDV